MKSVRRTISQRSEHINDIHEHGIDPDSREIWLHGYVANVDEEPGVEYRMAVQFEKNIALLSAISKDPILIRMHSTGGEWEDGMGIFDAIANCDCYCVILAYAHATSMSSVILQAADLRVLMPHTHVMVHYGSIVMPEHSLAARSWAAWEGKLCDEMVDIYQSRCIKGQFFKGNRMGAVKAKSFIHDCIKNKSDWIMDSKEAVYYGFADGIFGAEGYKLDDLLWTKTSTRKKPRRTQKRTSRSK